MVTVSNQVNFLFDPSSFGSQLIRGPKFVVKKLLGGFYEVYSNIFVAVLLFRKIQPHNFYNSKIRERKSGQPTAKLGWPKN